MFVLAGVFFLCFFSFSFHLLIHLLTHSLTHTFNSNSFYYLLSPSMLASPTTHTTTPLLPGPIRLYMHYHHGANGKYKVGVKYSLTPDQVSLFPARGFYCTLVPRPCRNACNLKHCVYTEVIGYGVQMNAIGLMSVCRGVQIVREIPEVEWNAMTGVFANSKVMISITNCQRQSINDRPAVVSTTFGSMYWYEKGRCHRDGDRPAVMLANGTREWWRNGVCTKKEQVQPGLEQLILDDDKYRKMGGRVERERDEGDEPVAKRTRRQVGKGQ